jgi:hypothetical protein
MLAGAERPWSMPAGRDRAGTRARRWVTLEVPGRTTGRTTRFPLGEGRPGRGVVPGLDARRALDTFATIADRYPVFRVVHRD